VEWCGGRGLRGMGARGPPRRHDEYIASETVRS